MRGKCLTAAQQKGASMRASGREYRGGYTREELKAQKEIQAKEEKKVVIDLGAAPPPRKRRIGRMDFTYECPFLTKKDASEWAKEGRKVGQLRRVKFVRGKWRGYYRRENK